MDHAAILLAAGRGSRMAETVPDKVLAPLAGKPVIAWSIEAFARSGLFREIVVVHREDVSREELRQVIDQTEAGELRFSFVKGGEERQESVYNGLFHASLEAELIFIHDAARPLVTEEALKRLHHAALQDGAAVLAHRVVDTIKQVAPQKRPSLRKRRLKNIDRSRLWAMETPQAFKASLILEAYRQLRLQNLKVTDDTAAATAAGHRVTLVESLFENPKITRPGDLELAAFLLQARGFTV
jgi:2-C-methyl-D-erythritol 4-phosphate cytidylyltransferase